MLYVYGPFQTRQSITPSVLVKPENMIRLRVSVARRYLDTVSIAVGDFLFDLTRKRATIRYARNHHTVLAQSVQSQLLDTVQESGEERSRRDKEEEEAAVKREKEVSFHEKGREQRERDEQKRSDD